MKKILYFLVSIILFPNTLLAQEPNFDINQILKTTTMPTDVEIMQMIEKFNFSQEENQLLFNETKKQLELMYSTQNTSAILDMYQNSTNDIQSDIQNITDSNNKRIKKYTNHPPLTRDWRK